MIKYQALSPSSNTSVIYFGDNVNIDCLMSFYLVNNKFDWFYNSMSYDHPIMKNRLAIGL